MSGAAFVPDPTWPTIVELATEYWGEPTDWSRDEVRWGAKGSKSVKPSTDQWHDHEANTGGGYIDMWRLARKGAPLPPRTNGHDDDYKSGHTHSQNAAGGQRTGGQAGGQRTFEGPKPWLDIGVVYKYLDAAGRHVLDVIRTKSGKPRFRQRRPDPSKPFGWNWKTRDIPPAERPLYRLPELLASADLVEAPVVYVCEGEKDSDNLVARGLIATTNSGGAGKWHPAYARQLLGRSVVILPDNDQAGRDHAVIVATSLLAVTASVKVLELPGLQAKGDVSDWLAAGGVVGELERLAREAPLWVPPTVPPPPEPPEPPEPPDDEAPPPPGDSGGGPRPGGDPGLPLIQCVAGQLPRMVLEAEDALLAKGAPIYQRSVLVKPAEQEYPAADGSTTHSAALVAITPAAMLGMLAKVATWVKFDARLRGGGQWVETDPPAKVVEILLANRGEWRFPVVRGVLTSPTVRPDADGSLLVTPGYDPASRYYLMFPSGLTLPEIPEAPTIGDALEALTRLDRLLDGYDFIEDDGVSRSVALSLLMTQVLRCGMAVSPLLAVSATAPGSGKSHLVDLASTIAIGRPCPIMGAGKNDEETEKGINTNLLSGVAGFSIDNVHRMVDLAVLNIATERPMIGIRLFGTLDKVEVENAVTIYMTGNNLPVIDEQVRRTVLCSLDAGIERPEQRDFAKGDPIKTVLADRGRYIADVLIIARAYLTNGDKPASMRPFGSYPGWSRLVREPLIWLGRPDPVASQNTTRAGDPEMGRLRSVTAAWHAAFGTDGHPVAYAVQFAMNPPKPPHPDAPENSAEVITFLATKAKQERLREVLLESFPGRANEIDTRRFGEWLRRYSNRIANGLRFRRELNAQGKPAVTDGANRWQVVP